MNTQPSTPQDDTTETHNEISYRYAYPWESVDDFKVNKWMLKLGAKWTLSEKKAKTGQVGFGDQWELHEMVITQTDAKKWYYAVHYRKWLWRVRNA